MLTPVWLNTLSRRTQIILEIALVEHDFSEWTHKYRVQAQDGSGQLSALTAETDQAGATTQATPALAPDVTVPAKATAVVALETAAGSIKVTWTAATDDRGIAIYYIKRDGTLIDSTTALTITDAAAGTSNRTYTVEAKDTSNNLSGASTASNTAATGVPNAVTGLAVTAVSDGALFVEWTAATDNTNGSGIKDYSVWRNGQKIATVTGTSYTETGLSGTTGYTYTVTANDKAGATSADTNASGTTLNANTNPGTGANLLNYSVSASNSVANTGTSTLGQSLAINNTGATLPAGLTVGGSTNIANVAAETANNSAGTIYNNVFAASFDYTGGPTTVNGKAYPGAGHFTAALDVDATLTLDAEGFTGALFILAVDDDVTVNADILLANGTQVNNVFFAVDGDITIAAGKTVWGNIICDGNLTLGAGAVVKGRIAAGSVVTLNANTISMP